MAIPMIALIAFGLFASIAVYQYIIHPACISTLSRVPSAHWTATFSPLWILNKRRQQQETPAVHEAHQRLGPIVRIAPNELSVNSVDGGIRSVYAGGYEKGDWYYNAFNNYGIMPMFAMPDHGPHSKRKRMVSNIYAKSVLQSSEAMNAITDALLNDIMLPRLKLSAQQSQSVEMYNVFCAMAMDFVSSYVFGLENATHFFEKPDMGAKFFRDYKARQRYTFWPQELPHFTALMSRFRLEKCFVPSWVGPANENIEALILSMCDKAERTVSRSEAGGEKGKPQDWPTVYSQLRNALLKDSQKSATDSSMEKAQAISQNRLAVASEMLDHTLAGFDTSSITLAFLAYELSLPQHREWQTKLRTELAPLKGRYDAKTLDSLPILHAILMESLRLHAAIPGNQPRITPPNATLGTANHSVSGLPAGVRVQAQAWSLHRNEVVFPNPESWNPGRWIDSSENELREMGRWFWAFGSGGRMCVGSNLAMLDMKALIAGIWSTFGTELVEGRGMVHNGGYVAEPLGWEGKFCEVRLVEFAK